MESNFEQELDLNDIFPVRPNIDTEYTDLSPEDSMLMSEINRDEEITTSYLFVNILLNLLIKKGIIHSAEVNNLLAELHRDYIKKKKR